MRIRRNSLIQIDNMSIMKREGLTESASFLHKKAGKKDKAEEYTGVSVNKSQHRCNVKKGGSI